MSDRVTLPSVEDYPIITGITQDEINGVFARLVTDNEKIELSHIYKAYQAAGRLQGNFIVPSYD